MLFKYFWTSDEVVLFVLHVSVVLCIWSFGKFDSTTLNKGQNICQTMQHEEPKSTISIVLE